MKLTTPLGEDKLVLVGFTGHEGISQLFRYQLDLVSEESTVPFDQLLGQKVSVEWVLRDGCKRYFSGVVSRFSQGERSMTLTRFSMEIVPQLWLLTRKRRSRIFQHISVPDILKKVLEAPLDVKYELVGSFEKRDYCTQYRESDFQFVSRLMEEEGIYYYFNHTSSGHQMVVANTPQSHPDLGDNDIIFEEAIGGIRDENRVWHWEKTQELRPGKYTLWDHSFELPTGRHLEAEKTVLETVQLGRASHKLKVGGNDGLEIYDYPGEYAQRFDGIDKSGGEQASEVQKIFQDNARTVEIRMQEETTPALVIQGGGNCDQFTPGYKFGLARHFSDGGKFVLTSVDHRARQPLTSDRGGDAPFEYENRFTAIPFAVPYRPPRITPVPTVQGSQTAIVVGPADEHIFTDKYGRVKVQFHWDRDGGYNADSACWVRVATMWAGKQWGIIHIPRIGQEVIVDFLEGHPDLPIVVGSVYNTDQMPPYKLPDHKTMSGIRTHTAEKVAGRYNANEIRFEDAIGKEQIFINAERDMDLNVEHDCREHIANNRDIVIDKDLKEQIKGDRHVIVEGIHKEKIKGDAHYTVDGSQMTAVTKTRHIHAKADQNESIGGNLSVNVSGSTDMKAGQKYAHEAGMEIHLKGGMKVVIEAGLQLTLKGAGGFVDIGPAGVTIQGTLVNINSGGAAGSGSGASPASATDPTEPEEPKVAEDGTQTAE
jgi:type VI secretion system secreted protein VgrG